MSVGVVLPKSWSTPRPLDLLSYASAIPGSEQALACPFPEKDGVQVGQSHLARSSVGQLTPGEPTDTWAKEMSAAVRHWRSAIVTQPFCSKSELTQPMA